MRLPREELGYIQTVAVPGPTGPTAIPVPTYPFCALQACVLYLPQGPQEARVCWVAVAHAFNPSTQKAEAGESL